MGQWFGEAVGYAVLLGIAYGTAGRPISSRRIRRLTAADCRHGSSPSPIFIWYGAMCPWEAFRANPVAHLGGLVALVVPLLLARRLP